MSGHEFIKIYDGLVPEGSSLIEEASQLESNTRLEQYPQLDREFFSCVASAVKLYSREFDYFTKLNSVDIADSGYEVVDVNELLCYYNGKSIDSLARIIMFLDDSLSELVFDNHGICIKGQVGRIVMFPSQWTHPFTGIGDGKVIDTSIIYG